MAESADSCGFRYIRQPNMGIDGFPVIVYNEIQFMYTKCKRGTIWLRIKGIQ